VGRPGSIAGRIVIGEAALPDWARASVSLLPRTVRPGWSNEAPRTYGHSKLDPDGSFRVENLVAGEYEVSLEAAGWIARTTTTLSPGGEAWVEVPLERAALVDFRGEAPCPASCTIRIEIATSEEGPWTYLSASRYPESRIPLSLENTVAPGTYRWRMRCLGGTVREGPPVAEPQEGTFTVGVGEHVEIVVPMIPIEEE
jgi:hypothetical protein